MPSEEQTGCADEEVLNFSDTVDVGRARVVEDSVESSGRASGVDTVVGEGSAGGASSSVNRSPFIMMPLDRPEELKTGGCR